MACCQLQQPMHLSIATLYSFKLSLYLYVPLHLYIPRDDFMASQLLFIIIIIFYNTKLQFHDSSSQILHSKGMLFSSSCHSIKQLLCKYTDLLFMWVDSSRMKKRFPASDSRFSNFSYQRNVPGLSKPFSPELLIYYHFKFWLTYSKVWQNINYSQGKRNLN